MSSSESRVRVWDLDTKQYNHYWNRAVIVLHLPYSLCEP